MDKVKFIKMSKKQHMGIDPGKGGSIVIIEDRLVVEMYKMPEDSSELLEIFEKHKDVDFAVLERVHGMPGMGGVSMFTFGKNYGHIEMALMAIKIPFETVTPQKWMKEFQMTKKKFGESKTQWKNRLKSLAVKLFPKVKVTLAYADALLIAEYCKRIH